MKDCAHCNRGLATMSGKVDVLFVARRSPFDHAQGSVYGGKSVKSTEIYPLDKVAWVLPDEINAMKNCTHCNRGLATISGEVDVLFIARLSPFDHAQGSVYGGKVGKVN